MKFNIKCKSTGEILTYRDSLFISGRGELYEMTYDERGYEDELILLEDHEIIELKGDDLK